MLIPDNFINIKINLTDFTIDYYEDDIEEYYNDIPIIEIGKKYAKLQPISEDVFITNFKDDEEEFELHFNAKLNKCYIDGDPIDPERLISLYEGDGCDPAEIIKKLTGIVQDDYVYLIVYKNGVVLRKMLDGVWKIEYNTKYFLLS